jgi:polyhydroxyalkanoate synthesis regulator phasin
MAYTDKHLERAETEMKRDLKEATETLSHKHEMLSAEFENFKQRDFRELEGRVTALEKKFAKL